MKFSWNWLNTIVNLNHIPLNEIINKLTLAGFEVEDILDQPHIQDTTIDLSITSNRADVNSIIGLGREISSILNCTVLNTKIYHKHTNIYQLQANQIVSDCFIDIRFNTLSNLTLQASPLWLTQYLIGCNIEPDNTINDLINYINTKWGQDIEAFDLQKIIKTNINHNENQSLEFQAIDQTQDQLTEFNNTKILKNVYLMKYYNKILSILGLESNSMFRCESTTSSIIIIGKIYKPAYIQAITSHNNIKNDISNKHLKGISRKDFLDAYKEIMHLFKNLNVNCQIGPLYTYSKEKNIKKTICIHKTMINNILGKINNKNLRYINKEEIINILTRLNFQPEYNNNVFSIQIPEYRSRDIIRPIDAIEEIARIYGFEKFVHKIPKKNSRGEISNTIVWIKKIRYILRNIGLHEVIHYSLEKTEQFKYLKSNNNILLYNPLLEEQSQLRSSLIPNLINAIQYNKKNQNFAFECFEIGKIFAKDNNDHEQISLAYIIGNPSFSKNLWSEKNKSMNWFQAKGLLENILEKLQAKIIWTTKDKLQNKLIINDYINRISHRHRMAILLNPINSKQIGTFCQINTKLQHELNIDYELYACEINISNLITSINYKKHLDFNFINYQNYPSVTRDISYVIGEHENVAQIQEYILSQNNQLIESVEIFNEYTKMNIKKEKSQKIIGFRITYRAKNRTLNDQDIRNIDIEIKNLLKINTIL